MKLRRRTWAFALFTSLALAPLAGCEKTSDVPRIQEEANGMVAGYAARFDDLHRRSEELMQRGRALQASPEDARDVSDKLMAANRKLGELRAKLQQAPSTIANAAKAGRDEVSHAKDSLSAELGNGHTEVTASIQAVEAWMERAEMGPVAMAMQTQPARPTAPTTAPTGAGSAEPSGTSTPPPTTPQPEATGAAVQAPTTPQPQVQGGTHP